ncbi:hypothetical protein BgiBS90_017666 [Biomphalaria glabrata]|nr:hypothetical protein BgiBS90_017666 [Biomphalaria glabrata]
MSRTYLFGFYTQSDLIKRVWRKGRQLVSVVTFIHQDSKSYWNFACGLLFIELKKQQHPNENSENSEKETERERGKERKLRWKEKKPERKERNTVQKRRERRKKKREKEKEAEKKREKM